MWAIFVPFTHYQQDLSNPWSKTSRRSDWIPKNFSDNGPPCNIQIGWTEIPVVGIKIRTATIDFTRTSDSISHNSIWETLVSCNIDHEYVSLLRKIYRDQKTSVQTDEEKFSISKRGQVRRSDVQSAVHYDTAALIKGRNTTMSKEKSNGNLREQPRTRLPHEREICQRRDAVCTLQRTDTKYDVRIQGSNRESDTQDIPRQDEDSQHPEYHEFEQKKIY